MNKGLNLFLIAMAVVAVVIAHWLVVISQPEVPRESRLKRHTKIAEHSPLPDFKSLKTVALRKSNFFEYLSPIVQRENDKIRALRTRVQDMTTDEMLSLAEEYRIDVSVSKLRKKLLKRIDVIPASLVMAQAAIESGWGTSRFARKGNNLFGEWCFEKGCGIVPSKRRDDAVHEVRKFASVEDAIQSYMQNLNSHPAYQALRDKRLEQRALKEPLSGCYMAEGLKSYSAKGKAYVESIKQFIRVNQLENKGRYCKAAPQIAKPKTVAAKAPVEVANEVTNGITKGAAKNRAVHEDLSESAASVNALAAKKVSVSPKSEMSSEAEMEL